LAFFLRVGGAKKNPRHQQGERGFRRPGEAYIFASFCQVSITESGFSDIDSIPSSTSHCAKSGLSEGVADA
jgi:hypothetical protein